MGRVAQEGRALSAASNEDLERAVDQVLEGLAAAWNAGDVDVYAEYFASDADFVDVLGRIWRGRDAIRRIHRANFDTIHKGSRVNVEQLTTRSLGDDLAVAHVRGMISVPAGPLAGDSQSTQTLVLHNEGGQWQITAFHNTFVREMPGIPSSD
jgi:uncharacterized protein (TIGR02246 family)